MLHRCSKKRNGPSPAIVFIRSMAFSSPAKDVVAGAAKQGIRLSERYVYRIRARDQRAAGKPPKPGAKLQLASRESPRPFARWAAPEERHLRKVIAEIGLARAREIFAEVEATLTRG